MTNMLDRKTDLENLESRSYTGFSWLDILYAVRNRLYLMILVFFVVVGFTVGLTLLQTPTYEASIKILISQESGSGPSNNLAGDLQGLQQLTQTVAEGIRSRTTAEAVIGQLGLETSPQDLINRMDVRQVAATQYVQVDYRDTDPQRTQQIANTVGDVSSAQFSEFVSDGTDLTVWERAALPDRPASPNWLLTVGLAVMLGLLLSLGAALLTEYLDARRRSQ